MAPALLGPITRIFLLCPDRTGEGSRLYGKHLVLGGRRITFSVLIGKLGGTLAIY